MKSIQEMSAAELFELAKKREEEEKQKQREALQGKIDSLKAKRREISARYRKDLKAIDEELQAITGRRRRRVAPARGGRQQATKRVLDLVSAKGRVTSKEIRAQLDSEGVEVANLSQLLAYLKKSGRIVSPQRSVYMLPK